MGSLEMAVGGTARVASARILAATRVDAEEAVARILAATRVDAEEEEVAGGSEEEEVVLDVEEEEEVVGGSEEEEVVLDAEEEEVVDAEKEVVVGSDMSSEVSGKPLRAATGSVSSLPTNVPKKCSICDENIISGTVCNKCASILRRSLPNADIDEAAEGQLFYCLDCFALVNGGHKHQRTMPLCKRNGSLSVLVSGRESWSSLFKDIQSHSYQLVEPGQLFPLHPQQGDCCEMCSDIVTCTTLQGFPVQYCTIECWLKGEASVAIPPWWVEALISEDFDKHGVDSFCIECRCGFPQSKGSHTNHNYLIIEKDPEGYSLVVQIPNTHYLARAWGRIEALVSEEKCCTEIRRVRVKDNSPRCERCNVRLKGHGWKICCLVCALPPEESNVQDKRCFVKLEAV